MGSPEALRVARDVQGWAIRRMELFSRRLAALVAIDSGPGDVAGRDAVARRLAAWATAGGLDIETLPTEEGAHLVVRLLGGGPGRVVLLGHHDTVFPVGTAAARPYREEGGRAFGPGVADMKGGLVAGLMALEALREHCPFDRRPGVVELHSVPDEETRTEPFAWRERLAGADAVLVLECGRENGDIVAGRKTGAWVDLVAEGLAAHAGTDPSHGRSAILALCREVLRCDGLNGMRPGVTVVTGTFHGGTLPNVVPDYAEAGLDIRALNAADLDEVLAAVVRTGDHSGVNVDVRVRGIWPGIEAGGANARLLSALRDLASSLGCPVGAQTSGGWSDGCWAAEIGLPTLDGLGPVGGRDHSPDEYIELESVPFRIALLAGLSVGGAAQEIPATVSLREEG